MKQLFKRPLGDILVSDGIITQAELDCALSEQKSKHTKLGETLVALGIITEEQVTQARAIQLDVAYVNIQEAEFDPELISMVPQSIARTYKLIPVRRDLDRITLAMANPMDIEAIDLVQFETKCRVEIALGTEWRILESINRQYGRESSDDLEQFMEEAASSVDFTQTASEEIGEDIDAVKRQSHTAPIVRMVNLILTQAVRKKASDIHIEPRKDRVDVRYRVDGELHLAPSIPKSLQSGVASRIKIMSELDIAERRMPQDGRISVKIDGKKIDLRVSTSPSQYGERVVLRVLRRSDGLIPLEQLGFTPRDMTLFRTLIARPYGIILVTGPTGSGKTTTLYAALNMLKNERINIMTVEDPIEYELEGINQTNVHSKIGLTFATQLRSILRQDPDIVLVGEVRDTETADVAFRAALTGHLVFSTLHANDAPSSVARLVDMGVEPFLVSSAIIGVTAQRLVRKLCPDCKEAYAPDERIKLILGLDARDGIELYRAMGCEVCGGTGYKGRTSITEMMVMTDEIQRLAISGATATEIRTAAVNSGMVSMRMDGMNKVMEGITTFEEVERKVLIETNVEDLRNAMKAA